MSEDRKSRRLTPWAAPGVQATGAWAERRRLADAMRVVIDRLVSTNAPEAELRAAADALERYAKQLETHPRRDFTFGFPETATAGDVDARFDYSPLVGLSNPLAPPISVWVDGDVVRGRVVFGAAYEGPPGCVHGGVIAASFDEVLGFTQSMDGNPGMTGTLVVRYRKPTPLQIELDFEGRVVRSEKRKILTEARLYAKKELCAEAEGIFVRVDYERFQALAGARQRRPGYGG